MPVDLALIVRLRGPSVSLWNRTGRCKRIGCVGVVDFLAKAPGMNFHELLLAEWIQPEPETEGTRAAMRRLARGDEQP